MACGLPGDTLGTFTMQETLVVAINREIAHRNRTESLEIDPEPYGEVILVKALKSKSVESLLRRWWGDSLISRLGKTKP